MNKLSKHLSSAAATLLLAVGASQAAAAVVYSTWTVNEGPAANVLVNVTHVAATNTFNWSLTINPWNAEALGLFVDFGNFNLPAGANLAVTNVSTSPTAGGSISIFATDTGVGDCGNGCNLNGNPDEPLPNPDGEWELIFRLGTQGFNNIQTWSWTTSDFGATEANLGLIAFRSQQNCTAGSLLPGGACGGSQKGYGTPDVTDTPGGTPMPEPASLALVGVALLGLGAVRRRRAK